MKKLFALLLVLGCGSQTATVNLTWHGNAGEYHVYRSDCYECPYRMIGTTRDTEFVDRTAHHGALYDYYIRSVYEGKESWPSNTFSVSVP